jgi:Schlafen, AlbA_2
MSSAPEEQAAIYVEENHTYDVDLGRQPIIQWVPAQGFVSVRVHIPYDGQLRYLGERQLKDVRTTEAHLPLGQIMVVFPENIQPTTTIPITMPAGPQLSTHLKSGKRMRLPRSIPIAQFNDTLIAIDGQIFDGADLDPGQLHKLIFEHTDAFVKDLRLQLSLWVPDLFARTPQSKERELREMLLQRESARQIFLPSISNIDRLAESLVALANGSGGRVLIGVDQYGQVLGVPTREDPSYGEQLKRALLVAALRSTLAVAFVPPDYLQAPDGKTVARVVVPTGAAGPYQIDGSAFYREGAVTVSRPAQASRAPAIASAGAIANIEDVLKAGDSDDVIILDAGNRPLNALELGPAISALINGGKRDGLILVRNLEPATGQSAPLLSGRGAGLLRQLEEHLAQELKQCMPHLSLRPALAQVNQEQIAVLQVSSELAPIVLYDGTGYDWDNRARRSLSTDEVFERYLRHQGIGETDRPGGNPVWMVYGELSCPSSRRGR